MGVCFILFLFKGNDDKKEGGQAKVHFHNKEREVRPLLVAFSIYFFMQCLKMKRGPSDQP